jgi:hypothetical protein
MSESTELSPKAAEVRAELYAGLATPEVVALSMDPPKSPRTVYTWIEQGLPTRFIGDKQYVVIKELAPFLDRLGRTRRGLPADREPHAPGRPRKAEAPAPRTRRRIAREAARPPEPATAD